MALVGNAFYEPMHKDIGCQCEKGFIVIRCSLDLSKWKDQEIFGVQIKTLNLLSHGYLAQVILTEPEQVNVFNDYCQLNHLIHKFFKASGPNYEGFVNLEFNSIPPRYAEGYPNEARRHKPYQEILTTRDMVDLILSSNMKDQLRL